MNIQGQIRFEGNIVIRPAGPADKGFLSELFHQTRRFIYDYADAEHDYKRMVVEHQEQLREVGYGTNYPDAMDFVVEDAGVRIGRVQIDFSGGMVRIVEIAILEGARGKGIGENVLRGVQQAAAASGAPVVLCCARNNLTARRLYDRLGFQLHRSAGPQDELIWSPGGRPGLIL